MYYLSLDNRNLHPIVIRDVRCVKGVMFFIIPYFSNLNNNRKGLSNIKKNCSGILLRPKINFTFTLK